MKKTAALGQQKSEVEAIERQTRAMQTSAAAFENVEKDINACIKHLEECEAEILRYEELSTKVARQTDALEKKKQDIRTKERTQDVSIFTHSTFYANRILAPWASIGDCQREIGERSSTSRGEVKGGTKEDGRAACHI